MAHILIVDDEARIRTILRLILAAKGHTVSEAGSGRAALAFLEDNPVDLVITDIRMDDMDGLALLAAIKERELGCPVIFVTAFASLESTIEALRLGAADYLIKPFEEKGVLLAVERALGVGRLLHENIRLKKEINKEKAPVDGVFVSPPMVQIRKITVRVATADTTVLLTGESGTGKEVVARLIHFGGSRRNAHFVAVNCAALSPSLVESELFGHEKGAFTGAAQTRVGKFEFAGNGTLFLDEVGELPMEAQAKLLRALQEKIIQRVGGNRDIPVHCRLICATNRDLQAMVAEGRFRQDLFYRLAVFPIHLPPLRDRRQDILPLVRHLLGRLGRKIGPETEVLTPAANQLLMEYPWPGNIRELANALERAVIMKSGGLPLSSDDFVFLRTPGSERGGDATVEFRLPPEGLNYEELQRNLVRQALEMTGDNQSAAARLLGLSRAKFRTLLQLVEQG